MHSADCWAKHHECAQREIIRLKAVEKEQEEEIKKLERRIEDVKRKFFFPGRKK